MFENNQNKASVSPEYLFSYHTIVLKSIFDVIPSFSKNLWFKTKYIKELNDLKINYNNSTYNNGIYYYLLQRYIKLSIRIETQVIQFSNQYFVSDYIIGLQIRTGKMPDRTEEKSIFYMNDYTYILQETLRIYHKLLSLNLTSIMYHFSTIHMIYSFLVTDNIEVKQHLSNKYPYILIYNSTIGHSEKESIQGYSQVAHLVIRRN